MSDLVNDLEVDVNKAEAEVSFSHISIIKYSLQ